MTRNIRVTLVAVVTALTMLVGCASAAASPAPTSTVAAPVTVTARVASSPPTYPYAPAEARVVWASRHPGRLTRPEAVRVAAYLNAVVGAQIVAYLRAVIIAYAQAVAASQSCTGPPSCIALVHAIFPTYGLDPNAGVRVMLCESGGNPNASNGGRYNGLFQHAAAYWPGRAAAAGFPGASPFNGRVNIIVSARMIRADGGYRQWECKP